MKFERTAVWGFDHALRGMRNPKESARPHPRKICGKKPAKMQKNSLLI